MSSPGKVWLNLLLWLGLLSSLGLEVYLLDRANIARDYYGNKLGNRTYQNQLYADTPLLSSAALKGSSAHLGKTVQLRGELYTPAPLHSKYFGQACSCYLSKVRKRTVTTRWETRRGTGKYAGTHRVEVKDESWETLSSEFKVAPLFLKDAQGQVPIALKSSDPYVYFQKESSSRREGELEYTDDTCPVRKAMVLIGQVERQNGLTVLTHLPGQTFRVDWVVPGEAEALEKDLARDLAHYQQLLGWCVGNGLFALGLVILLWRRRKRPAQA